MLVNNEFLFVSLPRCASTSFTHTCIKLGLTIKHFDSTFDNVTISNLVHPHERLVNLQKKFGNHHPIIAIKRNRHERFLSFWKQIIKIMEGRNTLISNHLKKLTVDDILFYNTSDIGTENNKSNLIEKFLLQNDLLKYNPIYLIELLSILYNPLSFWHDNNNGIIWFDINKTEELNEWVSIKIGKPFELNKINSSDKVESNLIYDEHFIKKYNNIYDYYDINYKKNNTLI